VVVGVPHGPAGGVLLCLLAVVNVIKLFYSSLMETSNKLEHLSLPSLSRLV
jgi:hypothetical protein